MMRAFPETLSRQPFTLAVVATAALLVAACGRPSAWGESNSLILAAADSLWFEVEDSTYAVLEPTIFTTREEKRFVVTQVDPAAAEWPEMRRFRNVLVFGTPEDSRVQEAASRAGRDVPSPPSVFQARDVFARGQIVTAVVLDPERPVDSWLQQLPAVLAMVESSFRDHVRARMFITGPDTALARQLEEEAGFRVVVPMVYRHQVPNDSTHIFRNDQPDPSQLIRSVLVSWRTEPLEELSPAAAYTWREEAGQAYYVVPQLIETTRGQVERLEVDGNPALEATGVWEDEEVGAFPAAGPFIAWLVQCPERTFFVDAWLYAPGVPKYEYMLQLREILNSFRC